jgi:hypothetical protein
LIAKARRLSGRLEGPRSLSPLPMMLSPPRQTSGA